MYRIDTEDHLLLPLIGFGLTLWLWTSLTAEALTLGLVWFGIGVIALGVLTRGFRRPPPDVEISE